MAENNTVSRGTTIGFSMLAAAGGAIAAMIVARSLDQPADLKNLEGLINANAVIIRSTSIALGIVATKQDDVRERLTVVEAAVERAGEDRYRGVQAVLADQHYKHRLSELEKAMERMESILYSESFIVNEPNVIGR